MENKAYIVLYACSLCRALYLDLVSSLETQEFIMSLKKFIVRKGRPDKIYADNGSTFVGAAGCLKKTMSDEEFNRFLPRTKSSGNSTLVAPHGGVDSLRGWLD